MADRRMALGRKGEKIAEDYLSRKGYSILERRYRGGRKEIDLVARQGQTIVFVEVKTDASGAFGPPESWVTLRKQQAIIRAARAYIAAHTRLDADYRFDVVGVSFNKGEPVNVRHIPGAFTAGD